jgi:hypothetical protein
MVKAGWGRIVNVTTKLDTMNRAATHPYGATNGYRFDANAWDASLPAAEAARPAGFVLHPAG